MTLRGNGRPRRPTDPRPVDLNPVLSTPCLCRKRQSNDLLDVPEEFKATKEEVRTIITFGSSNPSK